jgi:hypothetical protein
MGPGQGGGLSCFREDKLLFGGFRIGKDFFGHRALIAGDASEVRGVLVDGDIALYQWHVVDTANRWVRFVLDKASGAHKHLA